MNKLIWFGMQPATKHYKGREQELQTIHNCWLGNKGETLTFVGLMGLGGIGKSELARKYAHKFYTEVQGHCIWINAENVLSFTDSFHRLAKKIGISLQNVFGKEKTLNSLTNDIFEFLSMEKYLMVFDNLDNYEEDFFKCYLDCTTRIPSKQLKPFVILTSRYQLANYAFGSMVNKLQLSVLPLTSAVSFFKAALNLSEENEEVISDLERLCQELDHLPLAMQQAAAYINEMKQNSDVTTEIKEYLKIFKTASKTLLEYQVPKYQNRDSFTKPIYLTWQMTLDKIKLIPAIGSVVTTAINIISFFHSENISVTLLKSIIGLAVSQSTDKDLTVYEGGPDLFETLCNYSMCHINTFENASFLSVHRLVQEVAQIKLKEEQKWEETLNMLLEIVSNIFQDTVTSKEIVHIVRLIKYTEPNSNIIVNHQKFYNLLEQLQALYLNAGFYEQGKEFSEFAVRQIKHIYGDEGRYTLRMNSLYANNLIKCGSLTEAELLLNAVYVKQLKHFTECVTNSELDHNDVHYTKSLLATTWEEMGNYDKSLKMYHELLHVHERVFGIDHVNTITTKHNIARTHQAKGNYDDALQMYFEVLKVEERILGIEHPNTIITKHNIAGAHENKGNYDEAIKIYMEVMKVEERLLGMYHPDTITTKHNIAGTLHSKGNYDEALKIYLEVLEVRQRVLGLDHPNTINTKSNIALEHNSKGNYDEALKIYLEVLEVQERVLGIDHPSTTFTKSNIAGSNRSKGHYDEALKIYLEVYEVHKRVLGIDHPRTTITMSNIAGAHESKGNYEEALKLYLVALKVQERVLGVHHPETISIKHKIAGIYQSKGNFDEALKMYLEVLEVKERVFGIYHTSTLVTKNNIAMVYNSKGNYDEAMKMYLKVMQVEERVLGIEHLDTLATKHNIAATQHSKGNYDEAFKMYSEVLEVKERVLGIDHPDTLLTKNNIAGTHGSKRKYDEALKMYLEVLETTERVLGIDHPMTLTTKNNIAGTHASKGNYDEALKIYLEVLEVTKRVLGIDHPNTTTIKSNIAGTRRSKKDYDEAIKMYLEVLEVQERVLGIDHPDTITTKRDIKVSRYRKGDYDEAIKKMLEMLKASYQRT